MIKKMDDKNRRRLHRKFHIRKTVSGTASRPRMTVTRSNKNLSVQIVDDDEGKTLACISTLEKEFANLKPTVADAAKLGEALGARLKDKQITTVVFDRNGYRRQSTCRRSPQSGNRILREYVWQSRKIKK